MNGKTKQKNNQSTFFQFDPFSCGWELGTRVTVLCFARVLGSPRWDGQVFYQILLDEMGGNGKWETGRNCKGDWLLFGIGRHGDFGWYSMDWERGIQEPC